MNPLVIIVPALLITCASVGVALLLRWWLPSLSGAVSILISGSLFPAVLTAMMAFDHHRFLARVRIDPELWVREGEGHSMMFQISQLILLLALLLGLIAASFIILRTKK